MRALLTALLLVLPLAGAGPRPKVKLTTSMGVIVLQLEPEAAPKTVENFVKYVKKGHYNGTVFHRVIKDFMIQGGGHLPDLSKRPTEGAITNEADLAKAKGLTNKRGTVAMALPVGNPFGATAQFFINVKDNPNLNFKAKTLTDYGYCVFGRVVQGMDVVDRIRMVKTGARKDMKDVPLTPVLIQKAEMI